MFSSQTEIWRQNLNGCQKSNSKNKMSFSKSSRFPVPRALQPRVPNINISIANIFGKKKSTAPAKFEVKAHSLACPFLASNSSSLRVGPLQTLEPVNPSQMAAYR